MRLGIASPAVWPAIACIALRRPRCRRGTRRWSWASKGAQCDPDDRRRRTVRRGHVGRQATRRRDGRLCRRQPRWRTRVRRAGSRQRRRRRRAAERRAAAARRARVSHGPRACHRRRLDNEGRQRDEAAPVAVRRWRTIVHAGRARPRQRCRREPRMGSDRRRAGRSRRRGVARSSRAREGLDDGDAPRSRCACGKSRRAAEPTALPWRSNRSSFSRHSTGRSPRMP